MRTLKIAMVVGETSGDILGSGLIEELKNRNIPFALEGIGGPKLQALGLKSLYPMERLAIMGIAEVLGRLPELLRARKNLIKHWKNNPPDLFIGVDAPDFNLGLEYQLKTSGIKTVHYVSPSVWAWRQGRVKKIAHAVDKMLTLFPFEAAFYQEHGVDVDFVGHPMADDIPLTQDRRAAKLTLGLDPDRPMLALLPGSRSTELKYLSVPFAQAANRFVQSRAEYQLCIPFVSGKRKAQFEKLLADNNVALDYTAVDSGRLAMAGADIILLASGTAALEAALYKVPIVAAYKISPLTAPLIRYLLKSPYVTLPNVLSNREVIPEILQEDVSGQNLYEALIKLVDDAGLAKAQADAFTDIHHMLRKNASACAADAVLRLIEEEIAC